MQSCDLQANVQESNYSKDDSYHAFPLNSVEGTEPLLFARWFMHINC